MDGIKIFIKTIRKDTLNIRYYNILNINNSVGTNLFFQANPNPNNIRQKISYESESEFYSTFVIGPNLNPNLKIRKLLFEYSNHLNIQGNNDPLRFYI